MDNGINPAFPIGEAPGLSKREEIAARAMEGILKSDGSLYGRRQDDPKVKAHAEDVARLAIIHADALLAELAKPTDKTDNIPW